MQGRLLCEQRTLCMALAACLRRWRNVASWALRRIAARAKLVSSTKAALVQLSVCGQGGVSELCSLLPLFDSSLYLWSFAQVQGVTAAIGSCPEGAAGCWQPCSWAALGHAPAAHSACFCPRSAETYLLHWELLNTLLVLASTQLYTPNAGAAPGAHPFTEALLSAADLAPALVQVCRHSFC